MTRENTAHAPDDHYWASDADSEDLPFLKHCNASKIVEANKYKAYYEHNCHGFLDHVLRVMLFSNFSANLGVTYQPIFRHLTLQPFGAPFLLQLSCLCRQVPGVQGLKGKKASVKKFDC
eukprot:1153866-Pelagomonas_calceolata.AAC.2